TSTALSHNETNLSHLYVAKRDTSRSLTSSHRPHDEILREDPEECVGSQWAREDSTPSLQHFRYSGIDLRKWQGFRNEQNPWDFCRKMEEFREKHLGPQHHERSRRRDRDDRRASESSTRQNRFRTR